MTYRNAEGVLRDRLGALEHELSETEIHERALLAECEASEAAAAQLAERLAVSGPGGASRGPNFDRISVLLWGLCIVGVLMIPGQIHIGTYVKSDPGETVIPILLLAGPGVLAASIAWPYRRYPGYLWGVVVGVLLVLFAIGTVVVGANR
jgi:uncharacterized membrane protein